MKTIWTIYDSDEHNRLEAEGWTMTGFESFPTREGRVRKARMCLEEPIERKPMTEAQARDLFDLVLDFWINDRCLSSEMAEAERERDEALKIFDDLVEFRNNHVSRK